MADFSAFLLRFIWHLQCIYLFFTYFQGAPFYFTILTQAGLGDKVPGDGEDMFPLGLLGVHLG